MIVGLIEPLAGHIYLDGADITKTPYVQAGTPGDWLPFTGTVDLSQAVRSKTTPAILEDARSVCERTRARLETLLDE